MKECTFKPKINKSNNSNRVKDSNLKEQPTVITFVLMCSMRNFSKSIKKKHRKKKN